MDIMREEEKKDEYKTGYVYSIRSHMTDNIYIGSTFSNLSKRLYSHRIKYKRWCEGKGKCTMSREILKHGDEYIELIKEVRVKNKIELNKCEGEMMRENKDIVVNKRMEGRNKKEWYEDQKEVIKKYNKEYQMEHKEALKEYNKKYHKEYNKEHRDEMNKRSKEYHKEHRDEMNKRSKEYYNGHKEAIKKYQKEYRKEIVNCLECNNQIHKYKLKKHLKTKKHIKNSKSEI
jgi:hypothetical protein